MSDATDTRTPGDIAFAERQACNSHALAAYRQRCSDAAVAEFSNKASIAMRYYTGERCIEALIERYSADVGW